MKTTHTSKYTYREDEDTLIISTNNPKTKVLSISIDKQNKTVNWSGCGEVNAEVLRNQIELMQEVQKRIDYVAYGVK